MSKKVKNLRDLGGIKTADGRRLRRNLIYRSGHLCKIPSEEASRLRDRLALCTVIDLRTPDELSHKQDNIPEGVEYLHLPPLTNEENPAVTRETANAVLDRIMAYDGGAKSYLSDKYRRMIRNEQALASWRSLIDKLKERRPVLFHCSQGKDRTGVAAAVILLALGVGREEIMRDFMLTNRSCRFKNFWIFIGVSIVKLSFKSAYSLYSMLSARREYLLSAFDEIDSFWGGADGFLCNGLKLTEKDISELRELYLE